MWLTPEVEMPCDLVKTRKNSVMCLPAGRPFDPSKDIELGQGMLFGMQTLLLMIHIGVDFFLIQ